MAQTESVFRGQIGDLVVIEGHRVRQGQRIGEILAVLGEPGHEHYRVRWEGERETCVLSLQRRDHPARRAEEEREIGVTNSLDNEHALQERIPPPRLRIRPSSGRCNPTRRSDYECSPSGTLLKTL
jgi:Domain of unknown function (DUF1918)